MRKHQVFSHKRDQFGPGFCICWIACALLIAFSTSCKKKAPPQARPPAIVSTAIAIQTNVPVYIKSFGRLSSPEDIDIAPQVSGRLISVEFQDGDTVTNGQVLYRIDDRQYRANAAKAEAALAGSKADLKQKRLTRERNEKLVKQKLVSQEEYDSYVTAVSAAEATVAGNQAALQLAELDLSYCAITSPVTGVAGNNPVDPGNIVAPGSTRLVNIKSMDPIRVDFTITEAEMDRVRLARKQREIDVLLTVPGMTGRVYHAKLDFLDNTVDPQTGTLAMRATATNPGGELWPGQFVDVQLILGMLPDAVLVPLEAVQLGKMGPYAFVVTNNIAQIQPVVKGQVERDMLVVSEGLKVGDKVVTLGQMMLYPGAKVQESGGTQKSSASPSGKSKSSTDKKQDTSGEKTS